MGGALKQPAGQAGEGDPHMRMAQMADRHDEQHQHRVGVEQRERAHAGPKT